MSKQMQEVSEAMPKCRQYRYIPLAKAEQFMMTLIANAMGEGKLSPEHAQELNSRKNHELRYLSRHYGHTSN